ncbi:MAG: 5'-nucleotidase C-terminal domain-containing protein, partial [Nocardioidaceae bacterium]|nr:5'-nucleotidase C-terminal domain-containing protein [Nocardioidaceae bacterium]
ITLAEAYAVAPFNNILVSMDLTGQQVVDVLNQQYQPIAARGSRPMLSLGVSEGFTYEWIWDGPAPLPGKQPGPGANGHVKAGSAMLNGVPLDMSATYRVATLNFLQGGGDSFTAFQQGANVLGGPEDLANLADYMRANPGLTPPPDRVTGL